MAANRIFIPLLFVYLCVCLQFGASQQELAHWSTSIEEGQTKSEEKKVIDVVQIASIAHLPVHAPDLHWYGSIKVSFSQVFT